MVRVIYNAVSQMYGVDTDGDGSFDVLHRPNTDRRFPGIIVCADGAAGLAGEHRCAVVFDLGAIATEPLFPMAGYLSSVLIRSVHLHLRFISAEGGGSYELHGFTAFPAVKPADLSVSNRLPGPDPGYNPYEMDVTSFVRSQLALGAQYVGFSVRNVATRGFTNYSAARGESRLTVTYAWALPLADVPRLVVEIPPANPWALPRSDVARLVVELQPPKPWGLLPSDVPCLTVELQPQPPKPWGLPLSDVPGLVAEIQARVGQREGGAPSPASPIAELLQAVWIRELAASITEAGARSIQRAALELIGRIAADEVARLSREES